MNSYTYNNPNMNNYRSQDMFASRDTNPTHSKSTGKFGASLLDRPPSQDEVLAAKNSLTLLRSKMRNRTPNLAAEEDQEDRDLHRQRDEDVDTRPLYQKQNNNYRKVFKPNVGAVGKPRNDDYDENARDLNSQLDAIQESLNKKHQVLRNANIRINNDDEGYNSYQKPPLGGGRVFAGTSGNNKFGGNTNSNGNLNKGRNAYDSQEGSLSEAFPSRISKNVIKQEAPPQNDFISKPGPARRNLAEQSNYTSSMQSSAPKSRVMNTYQDEEEEQPVQKKNNTPNYSKNDPLLSNHRVDPVYRNKPGAQSSYNQSKYNDNEEEPTDTRNAKVFSKPLKKPTQYNEENEDEYSRQDKYKPAGSKAVTFGNNSKTPTSNKPVEEVPLTKLKGGFEVPDDNLDEADLIECPEGCGRKFKEEALEKHVRVCKKVFQTKRKQFDSAAARKTDEQLELEVMKPKKGGLNRRQPPPSTKQQQGGVPKWKQQSEALRAGLRAARGEELSHSEQQALNQQSKAHDDGLTPCPGCGRKFSEKAAEKHIPFCQSKNAAKGGIGGKTASYGRRY